MYEYILFGFNKDDNLRGEKFIDRNVFFYDTIF